MFQRDAKSTFSSILTGFVIHASAFVSVIRTDTSSIFLCRVSENWWCPWVEGCPRSLCLCEFLRQLSNQKKKISFLSTFYEGGCEFLVSFYFFVLMFFRCLSPLHLKYKNICFPGSNLKYEIVCENWTCLFLTCYSVVGIWIPGHQQSSSHLVFIHYCWFSPLPLRRHTLGLGRWLSAPSVC